MKLNKTIFCNGEPCSSTNYFDKLEKLLIAVRLDSLYHSHINNVSGLKFEGGYVNNMVRLELDECLVYTIAVDYLEEDSGAIDTTKTIRYTFY